MKYSSSQRKIMKRNENNKENIENENEKNINKKKNIKK